MKVQNVHDLHNPASPERRLSSLRLRLATIALLDNRRRDPVTPENATTDGVFVLLRRDAARLSRTCPSIIFGPGP